MRKIGKTVIFDKPPKIIGHAGVAGKKEGEGPLAKDFDMIFEDTTMGQQSYEKSVKCGSCAKLGRFCIKRRFA